MRFARRRQLVTDPQVQGALVVRLVGYWLVWLLAGGLALLGWQLWTTPGAGLGAAAAEAWSRYSPAVGAALITLPLALYDALRLSCRFVGPLGRLRRWLRDLAEGRNVAALAFRERDFWTDMANDLNRVAARLEQLAPPASSAPEQRSAPGAPQDPEPADVLTAEDREVLEWLLHDR